MEARVRVGAVGVGLRFRVGQKREGRREGRVGGCFCPVIRSKLWSGAARERERERGR